MGVQSKAALHGGMRKDLCLNMFSKILTEGTVTKGTGTCTCVGIHPGRVEQASQIELRAR